MVALEDLIALCYRGSHCLKHLVTLFEIEGSIRIDRNCRLVASCRLRIVFSVEPVCPSEVSPCKVVIRVHLDALLPFLHCIVRLDVVEEVSEVVVWL